jgi:hypothetical protein
LKILLEFVETCDEPSELFEVSKGAFDAVPLTIEGSVKSRWTLRMERAGITARMPRSARWLRIGSDRSPWFARPGTTFAQQRNGLGAVVRLAADEDEAERQAKFIRQHWCSDLLDSATERSPKPFFSRRRSLLVSVNDAGIDHDVPVLAILQQVSEDPVPDSCPSPP